MVSTKETSTPTSINPQRLIDAATKLYFAGHWTIEDTPWGPDEIDQAHLWKNLREALGISPTIKQRVAISEEHKACGLKDEAKAERVNIIDATKPARTHCRSVTDELWREYEYFGPVVGDDEGVQSLYHIDHPVMVYFRPDGRFHRILDSEGIVHCVPAPGQFGCVLRWMPKDAKNPVQLQDKIYDYSRHRACNSRG